MRERKGKEGGQRHEDRKRFNELGLNHCLLLYIIILDLAVVKSLD